jgi:hypothetical protein
MNTFSKLLILKKYIVLDLSNVLKSEMQCMTGGQTKCTIWLFKILKKVAVETEPVIL